MVRRKVQGLSERVRASPPDGPVYIVPTLRATPELLFRPEDSERLATEVWGRAICEDIGKLQRSDAIPDSTSQNRPMIFESVSPTVHVPNRDILATLQHLQGKIDHLQNTMEDMPLKVAEIMKQIWLTKGQDYMIKHVRSVDMVNPATGTECNGLGLPLTPLPDNTGEQNLSLQQVSTGGPCQWQNKTIKPVITDGQGERSQNLQTVITEGQSQQTHYIQPVFGNWHCQQQSQVILPTYTDEQNQEESPCTQPVLTDGQDPNQRLKLEPLCPEEKEALQPAVHYGLGSDQCDKSDPWCSFGQGPSEPSLSLGLETPPADEAALIDGLARSHATPERPLFKATTENGTSTKSKNLKITLKRWDIQEKKRRPTEDVQCMSAKGLKNSASSQKKQIPCTCTECGESIEDQARYSKPLSCHVGHHKCTYCEKSYGERSQPMTHLKIHTKENEFTCSACAKRFNDRYSLVIHRRSHMGETLNKCTKCNKSFTRRYGLYLHQRLHSGEKPYECTECGKHFALSFHLSQHQRSHTGERPYQCTECKKCFILRSHLITHQRTHTGERPYQCTECDKRFSQIGSLHNHQRIHSGEKPYECTDCGKHFNQMSNLRIHKRIHSRAETYECKECGKHFSHTSSLRRHQRLHTAVFLQGGYNGNKPV